MTIREGTQVSGETVLVAKSGGVTRLTLNRPDKLNAFTTGMHAELRAALEAAGSDAQCRVVVLTGAGRAFCAGQDLAETRPAGDGVVPDGGNRLEQWYNPLVRLITTLEKPVIAAVNGIAAGAGANVALACDLVFAARSASFLQAFTRIGLVPDASGTWTLPRLVGPARARGLTMLAEPLSGGEGRGVGADLEGGRRRQARGGGDGGGGQARARAHICAGPHQTRHRPILDQHARPAAGSRARPAALAGASPDAAEGIRAFLEKRPPKFTGRSA